MLRSKNNSRREEDVQVCLAILAWNQAFRLRSHRLICDTTEGGLGMVCVGKGKEDSSNKSKFIRFTFN